MDPSGTVNIALAGLSGYGEFYLNWLLNPSPEDKFRFIAGIDPYAERSSRLDELKQAGIPIFASLADFYQQGRADLTILSVPIQQHAPLTCLALAQGSNVLCEKPLAGALEDANVMLAAEHASGKFVAIGYQWSFSDAILALKQDILSGRFGRPLQFKTLVLWPRHRHYFRRNQWAGRIKTEDGAWVLDSPVNNATAHYLHNMLFLLGPTLQSSAQPLSLEAWLYRANPIENYDTAALKIGTESGAKILFITAHPVSEEIGPLISLEFENGMVEYPFGENEFQARLHDGTTIRYGSPDTTHVNKLWHSVDAVRTGRPLACGIETALPHLACVAAAQQAPIHPFSDRLIKIRNESGDPLTWVEGLAETLMECYQGWQLPSETRANWTAPATRVRINE